MPRDTERSEPPDDSSQEADFQELLACVRASDDESARVLFKRFERSVLVIVRHKLRFDDPLRLDLDSSDLAQLTWQTVFEQIRRGERFSKPSDLRQFIRAIFDNHYRQACRYRLAGKRTPTREEPLDLTRHDKPAAGPDPATQAEAEDELRQLLARVPEGERTLLRALSEGWSVNEVANRFGISARTVQRVVERARMNMGDTH